ncbi:MAG: hypothetical protein J6U98_04290 [Abditibacteriota bacterium]|nr:hypothetical protein [Abditibacteriota bacterium]
MKKTFIFAAVITALSASLFAATLNVKDFGAKGDGKTDDTAAFNTALEAANKAGGGIVNVPAARYCIKGNITVPMSVTLQGEWTTAPLVLANEGDPAGTLLLAYAGKGDPKAKPFITLQGHLSSVRGLSVYYPEIDQKLTPPTPYPPTIYGSHSDNNCVENVTFHNAYFGLRFERVGRFYINNLQGYPSYKGISIDECYDVGRVENCHFWPFGIHSPEQGEYTLWINLHGTAFEFERTDWQYVTNCFCFGYGIGYHLSGSEAGASNGSMLCVGADCCNRSVVFDNMQYMGWAITNGEFVGRWNSTDSVGVEIRGDKATGKIDIVNSAFWGPLVNCVKCDCAGASLALSGDTFCDWDSNHDGSPALNLIKGRAIVNACTFNESMSDIVVGKDMGPTIITSNLSRGGLKVTNLSKGFVRLNDNEPLSAEMTAKDKEHYIVKIGSPGDCRYISPMHYSEDGNNPDGTEDPSLKGTRQRWTKGDSCLKLPTVPGRKYHVTVKVFAPKEALHEKCGLYFGGKRIMPIDNAGPQTLEADITATGDVSKIFINAKRWVPGGGDLRELGILVRSVEMKAEGAKQPAADANKF